MKKIVRACTVSMSLGFVQGMLPDLSKRYEVVLVSSPGPEMEKLSDEGLVRCIAVPMERHISPLKDLKSLLTLIKVFWNERPQMVHSMTPKAGLLCMVAGWLTRVPVRVHTFTGLVFPTATGLKRRVLMLTDTVTCRCATHVIPEGEGVKADLQNYGITKKPLRVLGYGNVRGIDIQRFCRRTEIEAKAEIIRRVDTFTFLFVGRIVRDKGVNELVAAFQRLYQELPNARLLLIGFFEKNLDPVSEDTNRLITEHPGIEMLGEKTGDELIAYYAASDCFVFPSYREGFPNTVIEAGAMGLPCIVTDINGSREIITNDNLNLNANDNEDENEKVKVGVKVKVNVRKNGLVIPSRNVDTLYWAMKKMMTDGDMRQAMADVAREMIVTRFEQGFVRKCLYDYYDEILG